MKNVLANALRLSSAKRSRVYDRQYNHVLNMGLLDIE